MVTNRDVKRNRVKIFFIEECEKLLREQGLEGVTIRKIADGAGYNSGTIYNYFDDLEHLILFGSMKYLKAYTQDLADVLNSQVNFREKFIRICEIFNKHTFANPDIFWNMFFGRHSSRLDEVIREYYSLFPEELGTHNEMVTGMLYSGNMFKRDRILIGRLAEEGFIAPAVAEPVSQIFTRLQQGFLYEIYMTRSLDAQAHSERFLALVNYLLDTSR